MGETSAALEKVVALESAVERGDATAAARLGEEAIRRGPFGPTEAALRRAAETFPAEGRFGDLLLELHLRFKDWDGFDATLQRFVARFPRRPELRFVAGRACEERGRACAAIREYGRVARLDPDDLDAVVRMSHVFRDAGRPFLARRALRRALRRHPDASSLHAAMGYSYVEDGQHKKAVAAFYRAVSFDPDESPYLEELGVALLVAERWREAAAMAVRAIRVRPEREKPWTVYAVAHRRLGNERQAEQGFRKALAHAREPGRAHGNLGLFLAAHARPDEAREHLAAALEAHPDWEAVREALDGPPEAT